MNDVEHDPAGPEYWEDFEAQYQSEQIWAENRRRYDEMRMGGGIFEWFARTRTVEIGNQTGGSNEAIRAELEHFPEYGGD